jgi:dephospho-CoA kinase
VIVVGLTGSIGSGKSTTAAMFAARGVPVHDADRAVHALYAGEAVAPVGRLFPDAIVDGRVDRARLSARVVGDPAAMARLEAVVHPLVRRTEERFRAAARGSGARLCVLDIPLLFEGGRERDVDLVVVTTAPDPVQRERVLARPGMTADKLDAILARQIPQAEKRRRAHVAIDTGRGIEAAERAVEAVIRMAATMTGKG